MKTRSHRPRWPGPTLWTWSFVLLFLASPASAAHSGGMPGQGTPFPHPSWEGGGVNASPPAALLADGWWQSIYYPLESSLGSQRGMMLFATVGMLVALYVIWYRR